jgi:3-methyladenine DNA glycosylase AlkD
MSMNFAREQSLLRQRLQAKASPAHAEALRQHHGTAQVFLGATDPDLAQAAAELVAAHPQMGRAQMTAFVRTLWTSKIHELRAVGAQLLAARAALLEPHDLPLLEGFLRDEAADPVLGTLAGAVLGPLVHKSKKLWKELKRYATSGHTGLKRAALRAAAVPVAADAEAFARFAELAEPLLADADAVLQQALDETLRQAASTSRAEVQEFVARHARNVALPAPRPVAPKPVEPTAPAKQPTATPKADRKPAAKPAAAKPAAAKPAPAPKAKPKPKPAAAAKPAKTKAPANKAKASSGKKKA